MNTLTIDHVLITRFNLPTAGRESLIRAREGWLRQRVSLFDTVCLPSVVKQTSNNFQWLVYFDPESPEWFMEWIQQHESRGTFRAVFRTSISNRELVFDLQAVTGCRNDMLMTTNLDNDDALAADFVERLQNAVKSSSRTAIYFQNGSIIHSQRFYLRRDRYNAFCTVVEPWIDPVTAWADWHNRLALRMPTVIISGLPAWLQVVHGSNVSNAVHGRLAHPRSFETLFPHILPAFSPPSPRQIWADTALKRPLREMKSICRRSIKLVALAALGRDGLDRMKNWASAWGDRLLPAKPRLGVSSATVGRRSASEN